MNTKFKVGDRVKINPDSDHSGQSSKDGTVDNVDESMGHPIQVEFDDGYTNEYEEKDLQSVNTKKPIVVKHQVRDVSCDNHIGTYNSYEDAISCDVPRGKKYTVYELVPVVEIESVVRNKITCLKKTVKGGKK